MSDIHEYSLLPHHVVSVVSRDGRCVLVQSDTCVTSINEYSLLSAGQSGHSVMAC